MTDPIANYLNREGIPVQPVFFEASKILLGYEFEFYTYKIIYRIEQNSLIICDLIRLKDSSAPSTGLFSLFSLLRKMTQNSNEISEIKGVIIDNVFDRQLAELRGRLFNILLSKGAQCLDNDEAWLIFSLNPTKVDVNNDVVC